MEQQSRFTPPGSLPRVALATLTVAVCPILIGWGLRAAGIVRSDLVSVLVVVGLSLAASYAGAAFWRSRPGSEDVLFSDLMLWGWARRRWTECRLATTLELLGGLDGELSPERREQLLTQLAAALEARDPYTHGHSRRVARHATMIAQRMGLSNHQVAKVRTAASLHDVGKINTPTDVLHKPGPLTDEEFDEIKLHPLEGADMVASLGDPELTAMVRHHHERLDGTGYPDGLARAQIPLGARIIAVADTFDAITSTRPYRAAMPHKKALEILATEAGTQLDAAVVAAFGGYYSGRRPLAVWVTLSSVPARLLAGLGGGANVVAASSIARVMATSALATAAASAVAVPLVARTSSAPAALTAPRFVGDSALTAGQRILLAASSRAGGFAVSGVAPSGSAAGLRDLVGAGGVAPLIGGGDLALTGVAVITTRPSGNQAGPVVGTSATIAPVPTSVLGTASGGGQPSGNGSGSGGSGGTGTSGGGGTVGSSAGSAGSGGSVGSGASGGSGGSSGTGGSSGSGTPSGSATTNGTVTTGGSATTNGTVTTTGTATATGAGAVAGGQGSSSGGDGSGNTGNDGSGGTGQANGGGHGNAGGQGGNGAGGGNGNGNGNGGGNGNGHGHGGH